jgi:dihydroorotate dehydrogenase (fumarate)
VTDPRSEPPHGESQPGIDLRTDYLGLSLRNPLVASASPLSQTVDGIRRLAESGVGAVVMYSLFEEQVRREAAQNAWLVQANTESYPESLTYWPTGADEDSGPRHYLSVLERSAAAVDVPLLGSINGSTVGGWVGYARSMQDAGASAIELNVYYPPGDPQTQGRDVEDRHVEILTLVKGAVTVPVAVKLSPFFSSTGEMALRLDAAGADGLVLFNRFLHRDIDPTTLAMVSTLDLSTPVEARLPRAWIAILRGRVRTSLAGTTGVEGPEDVVKYLLAGADVVMSASALLRHGLGHVRILLTGLTQWMARKGFSSVDQMRGLLSAPASANLPAMERAGYVDILTTARTTYLAW